MTNRLPGKKGSGQNASASIAVVRIALHRTVYTSLVGRPSSPVMMFDPGDDDGGDDEDDSDESGDSEDDDDSEGEEEQTEVAATAASGDEDEEEDVDLEDSDVELEEETSAIFSPPSAASAPTTAKVRNASTNSSCARANRPLISHARFACKEAGQAKQAQQAKPAAKPAKTEAQQRTLNSFFARPSTVA